MNCLKKHNLRGQELPAKASVALHRMLFVGSAGTKQRWWPGWPALAVPSSMLQIDFRQRKEPYVSCIPNKCWTAVTHAAITQDKHLEDKSCIFRGDGRKFEACKVPQREVSRGRAERYQALRSILCSEQEEEPWGTCWVQGAFGRALWHGKVKLCSPALGSVSCAPGEVQDWTQQLLPLVFVQFPVCWLWAAHYQLSAPRLHTVLRLPAVLVGSDQNWLFQSNGFLEGKGSCKKQGITLYLIIITREL